MQCFFILSGNESSILWSVFMKLKNKTLSFVVIVLLNVFFNSDVNADTLCTFKHTETDPISGAVLIKNETYLKYRTNKNDGVCEDPSHFDVIHSVKHGHFNRTITSGPTVDGDDCRVTGIGIQLTNEGV